LRDCSGTPQYSLLDEEYSGRPDPMLWDVGRMGASPKRVVNEWHSFATNVKAPAQGRGFYIKTWI